jgi:hypothetical protein
MDGHRELGPGRVGRWLPRRPRLDSARMRGAHALRRLQLLAAWLTPVLLGLLAAVYVLVSDRTPWGEWLTIWPPVGWGVLFFVRALVMWLEGHRRLSIMTVALSVLFVVVTTEVATMFRRPDPATAARFEELRAGELRTHSQQALRIVSWNVAGRAPLPELEKLDPDICVFQEIGGVAAAMKASGHWNGFQWFPALDPGTLTRYPATVVESTKVGPWTAPQLLVVALPNGQRLLVANVRLVLPSTVVSVASLSDFGNVTRGHHERVEQFARLAALLRTTAAVQGVGAIVLAGDFNTPGGMASLAPLKPLLRDAWRDGGIGWGGTMTADMPVSRIDQCWVSRGIEIVAARVAAGKGSDHRMLVIDLVVDAPGQR